MRSAEPCPASPAEQRCSAHTGRIVTVTNDKIFDTPVYNFTRDFPYLYDETQAVARAYRAACTPDFFLFDGGRRLVYRGQLDASRPGNGLPVTGADLRAAVDAVLAGRPVPEDQRPSLGCNIKWKPGNEPEYG